MKTWRKFWISMVAAVGLAAGSAVVQVAWAADSTADWPTPSSPLSTVAAMQPGWNLGNTFDAIGADETAWGNPRVTREFLHALRAQGFKSIRMPATWGQHEGAAPDYRIDAAFLARVRQVVDWAVADGFYVMLNAHHDSWQWVANLPGQHDAVLAQFTATWTQLAGAFGDESRKVLFESINEPFFNGSADDAQSAVLLGELNTAFHTVVRGSGRLNATRLLAIPSVGESPDQGRVDLLAEGISALHDPNLVATVHYYSFWPFSVNIAGFTTFNDTTRKDLTDTFDRLRDTFVAKGIPVIIGEYGLLGWDAGYDGVEHGEQLKYFEQLGYSARTDHLTTMLWDNGGRFNRNTLQWNDPSLYRQIKSSWSVRSGTASTDQLFVRTGQATTDQTITLNLNANALVAIWHGRTELVRGKDYTVSGDQLTIKAAVLARITAGRPEGVDGALSLRFSRGVPWDVDVITYDTPELAPASGTTASLVIPAAFHGDRLATMEAVYPDGTPAGPQNWTPYKEFNRAFKPDTTSGTVTLPDVFFNEVNDNTTVNLTFHFWSGALLKYTVTRSGTAVSGAPA